MLRSTAVAVAVLALALPARAAIHESVVLERFAPLLGPLPQGLFQVPPASGRAVSIQAAPGPVVKKEVWDRSAAPPPAIVSWLTRRIPGMPAEAIREISYADVADALDEEARRGGSNLDLFSDLGLRGDEAYYISQDSLRRLFADFDMAAALKFSGRTTGGQEYHMEALVMGRGAVHILYDLHHFETKSDGNTYVIDSRVTESIEGAGRLAVSGMWVKVWPFTPRVEHLTKLGGGKMRVDTNYGSKDLPDDPIRRR